MKASEISESEESWIQIKTRIVCEYILGPEGCENKQAIGEVTYMSLPQSMAIEMRRRFVELRQSGIAYEIEAPSGFHMRVYGKSRYHTWLRRLQRRFGSDAQFKIRSLRTTLA